MSRGGYVCFISLLSFYLKDCLKYCVQCLRLFRTRDLGCCFETESEDQRKLPAMTKRVANSPINYLVNLESINELNILGRAMNRGADDLLKTAIILSHKTILISPIYSVILAVNLVPGLRSFSLNKPYEKRNIPLARNMSQPKVVMYFCYE